MSRANRFLPAKMDEIGFAKWKRERERERKEDDSIFSFFPVDGGTRRVTFLEDTGQINASRSLSLSGDAACP